MNTRDTLNDLKYILYAPGLIYNQLCDKDKRFA